MKMSTSYQVRLFQVLLALESFSHTPMTQGSVLLSANVKAKTLCEYLKTTKQRIRDRAQAIVNGVLVFIDISLPRLIFMGF